MNPTLAPEEIGAAIEKAYPELDAVREAAEAPVYLVGGAVRDLLLGRGRTDVDLVVVGAGEGAALASALGAETAAEHGRFATAKVRLDGHEIDLATARTETYPHPGALPEVSPATDLGSDLGRRDFSVNAMAVPLLGEPLLLDPHGGAADLDAGLLRVLHESSFLDDPTRAVRAARYAARLGLEPEVRTGELLRAADLETVSADRRRAELLRLAAEPSGPAGFALLEKWGVEKLREAGAELAARVAALLSAPPWEGLAPRPPAVLAAAIAAPGEEAELAAAPAPPRPSRGAALARGHDPVELVLARALGAEWLDRYVSEWRDVAPEIGGEDLMAAGVPEGPAVGAGLAAARDAKLDGEAVGREAELRVALAAARQGGT